MKHFGVGGHTLSEPDISPDYAVMTHDCPSPQDSRPRVDDHSIFDRRVPLDVLHFLGHRQGSHCHSLVDFDIIADDARLPDHDARPVVDQAVPAYLGSRVDLNPSFVVCGFSNDSRNQWHFLLVELVCNSVEG